MIPAFSLKVKDGEFVPLVPDDEAGEFGVWWPDGRRTVSWSTPLEDVHPDLLAFLLCQLDHVHDMAGCVPCSVILGES